MNKKDGNFKEIDVVIVSEIGIHVIEAKARVGEFCEHASEHYAKYAFPSCLLSKEEVDEIANIVNNISHDTPKQRANKVAKKIEIMKQGSSTIMINIMFPMVVY